MSDSNAKNATFTVRDFFASLEEAGVFGLSQSLDSQNGSSEKKDWSFEDLAVDSFTAIEIAVKIEEKYRVSISPESIVATKTVMTLYHLVARKSV